MLFDDAARRQVFATAGLVLLVVGIYVVRERVRWAQLAGSAANRSIDVPAGSSTIA